MKTYSLTYILLFFFFNQTVLAIDLVYEGENGIRAKVFETNCLACHSSELSGSDRNGAPPTYDWDIYDIVVDEANEIIERAVEQMNMPPSFFGLPLLNQEQKDALLAWKEAGFPENSDNNPGNLTNASYDFANSILTLPVVNVGASTFVASLKLIGLPGSPLGLGFVLEDANLTDDTSATAASFDPVTGVVDIPLVDLLNDAGNRDPVSAKLLLIPGSNPLQFEVTSIDTPAM